VLPPDDYGLAPAARRGRLGGRQGVVGDLVTELGADEAALEVADKGDGSLDFARNELVAVRNKLRTSGPAAAPTRSARLVR
jgi:hypothetical protein